MRLSRILVSEQYFMKIAWITVLYHTPQKEIERFVQEIYSIDSSIGFFSIDNTNTGKGYAQGVNEGVRKALAADYDIFIISNPDISVKGISREAIREVLEKFDVAGFAMRQNEILYYGGELDTWRMSGGLITKKPIDRYVSVDFVSGALMVVKREVTEHIGLLDESYGMYYEDVDYCIRARQAGCTVGIDTEIIYDHFETSDTNPHKQKFLANNRWRILWKYGTWQQKLYEIVRLPKTLFGV